MRPLTPDEVAIAEWREIRLAQFKRELPWLLLEGFSQGVALGFGVGLMCVLPVAVGVL